MAGMSYQTGRVRGVYFELAGVESGPMLVLSHSLGGDLSMWDTQVDAFAGDYQVLRYDTRGHGKSAVPGGALTLADLGRDVLGLLDHHGVERAHFCGVSLGGMTGQWLGMHAPERLLSLVLADTAPRMGTDEVWNERVEKIEQGGTAAIAKGTMERWFTRSFRDSNPTLVAHYEAVLVGTAAAGYISCARVVQGGVLPEEEFSRLNSIGTRTLVLTGSEDAAATPEASGSLAGYIPGATFVELEAAHIAPVEASAAFNAAVREFLAGS